MNKFSKIILGFSSVALLAGCSDWLQPTPVYTEPENINTPEYYEALRAYKASDHTICFGWFSGWNGSGTDMQNQLRGIPDSMDVVSHWNPVESYVEPLSAAQIEDLKAVQAKGTKVLFCLFWKNLGFRFTPPEVVDGLAVGSAEYNNAMTDYWGWYRHGSGGYDRTPEADAAIRKYAQAMTKYVIEQGYDGIDFDYEYHWGETGNIVSSPDAIHVLLDELSKNFGPKSGTGRVLMVDGEPQSLNAESGPLIDYYCIQAYSSPGDAELDNRFAGNGVGQTPSLVAKFGSVETETEILRKTVWTETFEGQHKNTGGPKFTTRDGETTYSLMGMAKYYRPGLKDDPAARVGGFGAYRFDMCRPINDYYIMRRVIQAVNPANKPAAENAEVAQ